MTFRVTSGAHQPKKPFKGELAQACAGLPGMPYPRCEMTWETGIRGIAAAEVVALLRNCGYANGHGGAPRDQGLTSLISR